MHYNTKRFESMLEPSSFGKERKLGGDSYLYVKETYIKSIYSRLKK